MKVYGLPEGQGLDHGNDMAQAANDMAQAACEGDIIPAVQVLARGQSINHRVRS